MNKKTIRFFDEDYYQKTNPDIPRTANYLAHWLEHGIKELRSPCEELPLELIGRGIDGFIAYSLEEKLAYLDNVFSSGKHFEVWKKTFFSDTFSPRQYFELNPDLQGHGIDPYVHWILYGIPEGRKIAKTSSKTERILFVDGISNASSIYRVANKIDAIGLVGNAGHSVNLSELPTAIHKMHEYDKVVFFRTPATDLIIELIKRCKVLSIPTIYDIDDLVFPSPNVDVAQIDGYNNLTSLQQIQYKIDQHRYLQCAQLCDHVTASTPALAQEISRFHPSVSVVHNTLSLRLFRKSALAWFDVNTERSSKTEIVFLSGSNTHNKDFNSASGGILEALQDDPSLTFHVIGELDTSRYRSKQITKTPKIAFSEYHDRLPDLLRNALCNIAPLELNNAFCDCKSDLKYFEAAAFGVPTIASPTASFKELMRDGVNGYLPEDEQAWKNAIFALRDAKTWSKIVENGRVAALSARSPLALIEELSKSAIFRGEASTPGKGYEGPATLNWIIPGPIPPESGGHNSIMNLCRATAKLGINNVLYLQGEPQDYELLEKSVQTITEKFPGENIGRVRLAKDLYTLTEKDAVVFTHYSTHYSPYLKVKPENSFYLVQDFEPMFNAFSYEYQKALDSYTSNHKYITIGKWLPEVLMRECGVSNQTEFYATSFWIDRQFYYPPKDRKPNRKIAFLARPSMPRRFYELAVEALQIVKKSDPSVQIYSFGEPSQNLAHDKYDFSNMGVLTREQLGELYREAAIGLCFSTTNPSLITFEMMGCGLPVIDLDINNARSRHDDYPALLSSVNAKELAFLILETLSNNALLAKISREAVNFTAMMRTIEEEMGDAARYMQGHIST